ncbi:SDR family NAD(P)-dependent oxidoreductase, partial [Halovivax sp.]|uniref:SDR family NAD(P)-dependent oxidoreductase n=1 Tax=Halovivax sp. TaxID=1935978 RepID=UPI0025C3E954
MSADEAIERYGPSEITANDLLVLDDPHYRSENVAVVTGAGSGIGRATALAFAANGLTVVGTDLDAEAVDEAGSKAEGLSLPGEIVSVAGNLVEETDIERIVEEAADYGSIRYLVNNAGLQHVAPIESFPVEKYDTMQAVMQRAPLLLTKECLPHFRANEDGGGVVGNMCSVHGHIVTRDKAAYNMSKFALRGLTQSIAAEGDGSVRA